MYMPVDAEPNPFFLTAALTVGGLGLFVILYASVRKLKERITTVAAWSIFFAAIPLLLGHGLSVKGADKENQHAMGFNLLEKYMDQLGLNGTQYVEPSGDGHIVSIWFTADYAEERFVVFDSATGEPFLEDTSVPDQLPVFSE
ncbi:hypothetical protein [Arthrobacter sp. VKM Ac-2550]|uniref:hypothetical protein n=1 Tax=Crystallibacter permensis TaxID=1938888 RepID=UPI0022274134|nr:hypothetical protein [Arthrobacter sp. VKM Ac-2550]MCW2132390.1 hypothetical protein [Arthrobacter sp. VKM Ac-2550]